MLSLSSLHKDLALYLYIKTLQNTGKIIFTHSQTKMISAQISKTSHLKICCQKDGNDNPIFKTEKETQMYRTDFWTLWGKARVGCFERTASKHVYYLG